MQPVIDETPRRGRATHKMDSVGFVSKKIRECGIPLYDKKERSEKLTEWLKEYHDDDATPERQKELIEYIVLNVWHLFPFMASQQNFQKSQFEEALQNLTQSIMRAVELYDPKRGVKFISYIHGYIKEGISRTWRQSRVIDTKKNPDTSVTIVSLSEAPSASIAQTNNTNSSYAKYLSLEDTLSYKDVADSSASNCKEITQVDPEEHYINTERVELLLDLLTPESTVLSDKERCVVKYRFGISGTPRMTLDEIAEKVFPARGWTGGKVWVHQIEKRALLKMRSYLQKRGLSSLV